MNIYAKSGTCPVGGSTSVRRARFFLSALIVVMLTAAPLWAQDDDPLAGLDPEQDQDAGALALPAITAADSVHTNIWLTEALMAEIVTRATRVLPPAPAAVRLVQTKQGDEDDLLKEAMVRVLGGQGYTLFLPDEDEARQAAVDFVMTFHVVGVDLVYPEVGRTLGLWRQWVSRELEVTAQVELSAADSGRILFSDRITRSFADRIADDDFRRVDSSLYDFTTAETAESGWHRRLEEIIVLGTLAGLVAVYFANTTD
jgi:hypothetical protein